MTAMRRNLNVVLIGSIVLALGAVGWSAAIGIPIIQVGADNNSVDNPFVQPQDPAQSGGGRDQTMQLGDLLKGTPHDDLLIGGLGTDVLFGAKGNDVIVGGVEHFNPANRDRAFGGLDDDVFVWAPGDGSDHFTGGRGTDVVMFGILGELDENGEAEFSVKFDQETAPLFIDEVTGLPVVDVANSPGFCEIIDDSTSLDAADELDALGLDHLVRFFIRAQADNGSEDGDNGLRVTLHLRDVEYVVCTSREGGEVVAFDISVTPPVEIPVEAIPVPAVLDLLRD